MGALHLLFWVIATYFGLRFLYRGFRHFGSNATSGIRIWMAIFVLVALQMTTALRPLVGTGDKFLPGLTEKKFFVNHWFECLNGNPEVKEPRANDTAQYQ